MIDMSHPLAPAKIPPMSSEIETQAPEAPNAAPLPRPAHIPESALLVDALDIEAQGVARRPDGKVVFIEGALPGEWVGANVHRKKNNWEAASLTTLYRESSQRVTPRCPHFGLHEGACGGCKMQHLHAGAQVAIKQRVLEDNLWHLGKVKAETLLRPIEGPAWGYRWRARFSVRHVRKKGAVLVGFHERKSRYVADIKECHVVPPQVSNLLLPLRALIGGMDAIETCPQIELAGGVDAPDPTREVIALDEGPQLAYKLPEFGVTMPFKPTDFTQVNPDINQVLVGRGLRLLDPQPDERVIDWFCGLGNFTLPIATRAGQVLGIEGSQTLVARSQENYERNAAQQALAPTRFVARNLFEMTPTMLVADGHADKWLVDPPREGAFALAKALADLHQDASLAPGWQPPQRIVYVSCNPATLARDAGLLVHQAGYRCTAAGVVNMFPHTAHVESMAVFELA